ncbi:SsgA family sporulation/cell division regulator [Amycolatopsis roodepoortensis]|uniref:SsgA family sporulation/cell division regulator n=1 Tax=Amycolatopsis roodepoortensis TaxID=700274 RepID=UPI00214AC7B7|nr:SsgA family sporulation/cell division regulator [Amycolatopsis roodepoortensis]UUV34406.1 SsgA family sporulation/cell division regulator [Amycolatopsis roodepoortensis]
MTATMPAAFGPRRYFGDGHVSERPITATRAPACSRKIGIEFRYDPAEPFAVTLVLGYRHGAGELLKSWTFARSMLAAGRTEPAGADAGDVQLFPRAGRVDVDLADRAEGRRYLLTVRKADVDAALAEFDKVVPLAAEDNIAPRYDAIAAELAAILADGGDR